MSRRPNSRRRREQDRLRRGLVRGEHVEVDCQLRRTSARGWGPWTDAIVVVGPLPAGAISWHVEDPISVGLPSTNGPVDADFVDIDEVDLRPVRFRTEAFWGLDGAIVVVRHERATTELALPPALVHPLLDRLTEQLLGPLRSITD